MTLAENIKNRRINLKLSQEYIADQLGISRQAVAKWESGKSEPSAANLAELAVLLETNVKRMKRYDKKIKEKNVSIIPKCL